MCWQMNIKLDYIALQCMLWCFACYVLIEGSPVITSKSSSLSEAYNYLLKYGYISQSGSDELVDPTEVLPTALTSFQRMARIPVTGVVDEATKAMMSLPRCGVHDPIQISRQRRYYHSGTKWRSSILSWRINRFSDRISQAKLVDVIRSSFKIWSDVTNLHFEYRPNGPVDIEIMFTRGDHNDGYSFDDRGGVLAHAFFPPLDDQVSGLAGDIHFDEGEPWTVSIPSTAGQDLLSVAVHEIGHALGLQHSYVIGSIMWPWSEGFKNKSAKLAYDDILAIQLLYGGKRNRSLRNENTHFLCQLEVDALFRAVDGNIYLFSGEVLYKLDNITFSPICDPQFISSVFQSFPSGRQVDDAVTYQGKWTYAKSYIFAGNQYYRYSRGKNGIVADEGFPKPISFGWGMTESNFDSVFLYQNQLTLIFVKGTQYWLHTGTSNGTYPGYPRSLSSHTAFRYLNGVEAAYLHTNMTNYFFQGGHAYSLDHTSEDANLRTIC